MGNIPGAAPHHVHLLMGGLSALCVGGDMPCGASNSGLQWLPPGLCESTGTGALRPTGLPEAAITTASSAPQPGFIFPLTCVAILASIFIFRK